MTLTKAQIVDIIRDEIGFTRNECTELVESLLEIIKSRLESGEDVLVSGFGKFCVKQKRKRRGRNPATGDELILASRKVVTFQCSGKLREKVNKD
jgi:integration host factor subunit alpha